MVLEDERKGKCLHESAVNRRAALLIEILNVLRKLRLLLLGSLDVIIEVLIEEVKGSACCLVDLEEVILQATVDSEEDLLDHLKVELKEHELQVIAEE